MGTSAMVSVRGVRKRFGSTVALDGTSLEVRSGEAVGLLGPNGAGKSTLVKSICGLVAVQGSITVAGDNAGSRVSRRSTGYLAELFRFPPWLTSHEVLQFHQQLARSRGGHEEREQLLALVELTWAGNRRVAEMSKGMQQRLGLAQALIGNPTVLILDEPTSALDPTGRHIVREIVRARAAAGVAVLISSHLLSEVEQCCDRAVVLHNGAIAAEWNLGETAGGGSYTVDVRTDQRASVLTVSGREEIADQVASMVAAGERIYEVAPRREDLESRYLALIGGSDV